MNTNKAVLGLPRRGSNLVQLTLFGGSQTGSPRRSADGRSIAFDSRLEGHSDIFVISAEGAHLAAWILYSHTEQTDSDIMLVENFR